jgi:hypothetical protein
VHISAFALEHYVVLGAIDTGIEMAIFLQSIIIEDAAYFSVPDFVNKYMHAIISPQNT